MQFDVIYLETWGSTQPYFAFSTLEFRSFFFAFTGTHKAPNSLTLLKPVSVMYFVKSYFCWLLDGVCFPCLVLKMLSGVLIGVGRPCLFLSARTSSEPADNRYSRSTVRVVSRLCSVCASNIICVIVSITLLLGGNILVFR